MSTVEYLLSLAAVRDRAGLVGQVAQASGLNHFELHRERLDETASFVLSIIKRDYGPDKYDTIPPHGRWQHVEAGNVPRIAIALEDWKKDGCEDLELTRRLVDLFFVSVLLDAGAGDTWRYVEPGTKQEYERSEGIAIASFHMFMDFAFATERKLPIVDGRGLEQIDAQLLAQYFQISDGKPILGLQSRVDLLKSLGKSLLAQPQVFGTNGRPGNLVDYMRSQAPECLELDLLVMWDALQKLLIPIWPKDRTCIDGQPIGDAWPLSALQHEDQRQDDDASRNIQPFHKLTQWLAYSLMVPFQRVMSMQWKNTASLTALAEYRNGGLFVDFEVLVLNREALRRGLAASGGSLPSFKASDDVIVEWRAMTLVLVDELFRLVSERLQGTTLTMAQFLEAGTWKSGREIAARKRPKTKSSPIVIESDGTVF